MTLLSWDEPDEQGTCRITCDEPFMVFFLGCGAPGRSVSRGGGGWGPSAPSIASAAKVKAARVLASAGAEGFQSVRIFQPRWYGGFTQK